MTGHFSDPALKLTSLTLTGEIERPVVWNSFPGSVLHGVLGFTLKDLSCAVKGVKCEDCYLAVQCPYGIFLQSPRPPDSERMRKYKQVPSPLRLAVEPWDKPVLEPGERVKIEIVLTGKAAEHGIPVLMAFEKVLTEGVGRQDEQKRRGTIQLKTIEDAIRGESIRWADFHYDAGLPFQPVAWSELAASRREISSIEFTSPTRIVSGGRITASPSIRDILSTLFRRLTNLAYFHCGVEIEAPFKALLEEAATYSLPSNFQRIPAARYSGRQRARFRIDGATGSMDVSSLPSHFYPWLAAGSCLGVGKGAGMGMGKYCAKNI